MSSNSNTPSINGDETNAVDNKNKNSIAIANMSKSNEFILKNRKIGSNSAYSIAQKIRVFNFEIFSSLFDFNFLLRVENKKYRKN